jgi:hypothetical protein
MKIIGKIGYMKDRYQKYNYFKKEKSIHLNGKL